MEITSTHRKATAYRRHQQNHITFTEECGKKKYSFMQGELLQPLKEMLAHGCAERVFFRGSSFLPYQFPQLEVTLHGLN